MCEPLLKLAENNKLMQHPDETVEEYKIRVMQENKITIGDWDMDSKPIIHTPSECKVKNI